MHCRALSGGEHAPRTSRTAALRQQTCCRVAMCSSMATLPDDAISRAQIDLQLQLASSAAALAPVQQAVSEAFAAAAAVVVQGRRSSSTRAAAVPVLQATPILQQTNDSSISYSAQQSSNRLSTKASRQLTRHITQCSSWQELRQLHVLAGQQMNIIHISACLSRLGKLLRCAPAAEALEVQQLERFMQQLESTSLQLLSVVQLPLDGTLQVYRQQLLVPTSKDDNSNMCSQQQVLPVLPQQLSTMAWGWAVAGFQPGQHWWSCYWAASTPQLPFYRPQELATAIWAAGKLQQHPPAAWLASFWPASAAVLHKARPQELCMMLWGMVALELQPSSSWWGCLQAAVVGNMQQMTPRDISQVLWAHARLQAAPPAAWVQQMLHAAHQTLPRFAMRDAAMLLWSCAALKQQPSQQLLQGILQSLLMSSCKVQAGQPQDFAHILWALATLQQQHSGRRSSSSSEFVSVSNDTGVSGSSSNWGVHPSQRQQVAATISSSSSDDSSSLREHVSMVDGGAALFVPTPLYNSGSITNNSSSTAAISNHRGGSSGEGCLSALGSLPGASGNSSDGLLPDRLLQSWAGVTWHSVQPATAGLDPIGAAQMLWAGSQLGPDCWPDAAWLDQYWNCSRQQLIRTPAQHAQSGRSMFRPEDNAGRSGAKPQPQQQQEQCMLASQGSELAALAAEQGAAQVGSSDGLLYSTAAYSAQALAVVMWAGLKMGVPPPGSWIIAALPLLQQQLADLQPAAACQLLYVLAKLQHRPNPAFMQQLLSRLQLDAHLLELRAFACVLWSLGKLGFQPGENWWDVILYHLGLHVGGLGYRELGNVLLGLVALQRAVPHELLRTLEQRTNVLQQQKIQQKPWHQSVLQLQHDDGQQMGQLERRKLLQKNGRHQQQMAGVHGSTSRIDLTCERSSISGSSCSNSHGGCTHPDHGLQPDMAKDSRADLQTLFEHLKQLCVAVDNR